MADRNLKYVIGAQDTASAVFDKVARSSKTAHKSMQGDIDTSASKVKQLNQVLDRLADEAEDDLNAVRQAAERLDTVMGDDLTFTAREVLNEFERTGLSAQDVLDATEDEVRDLAQQLERLDSVASQAADGIEGGGRRASTALGDVADKGDQSRSVLANMAGNSAQDLGELGGVVGSLGVGIGQLAEYAVDGNIALRNLAGVAGPLAILAVGGLALNSIMEEHSKATARAQAIQEGYTEALLDTENAMGVTSETAENFLDSAIIRRAQEFGANLDVLADSIVNNGDELDVLAGDLQRYFEATAEATISSDELTEGLDRMGIAASPLTDELLRMADAGQLDQATYRDLLDELQLLSDEYRNSQGDVEARRAIEEALGIAIDDTAAATMTATEQLERHRDKTAVMTAITEGFTSALRDQYDAQSDLLSLNLDLEGALDRTEDTTREYNEAVAFVGESSEEATDAGRELLESYLAAADAAGESAEGQAIAAGRAATAQAEGVDAQITTLANLANNLAPGSPVRTQLEGHIWTLLMIPKEITTNIGVTGTSIENPGVVPRGGVGTRPAFASGTPSVPGPVGAPVDATVHGGEMILNPQQQRELFEARNNRFDGLRLEAALAKQTRALVAAFTSGGGSRRISMTARS